jgi:uncharacterized membrane protein YkvA (DUF1232 family)
MLTKLLPNIFNPGFWRNLWRQIRLAFQLVRDPRVPGYQKLVPALVVVYLLAPIDLIPGFLPIIGAMDDLALLALGLGAFIRLAPKEVVASYQE